MPNKDHYMPAVLIAALIAGIIGATPCLNVLNCCFCAPAVVAAMLAVRSVTLKANAAVDLGEGSLIGLIVGSGAGVITGTGTAIFGAMSNSFLSSSGILSKSPEFQTQMAALQESNSGAGTFCCWFIGFAMFGALGGLAGAAMFKPPGAPQQGHFPPPYYPPQQGGPGAYG